MPQTPQVKEQEGLHIEEITGVISAHTLLHRTPSDSEWMDGQWDCEAHSMS